MNQDAQSKDPIYGGDAAIVSVSCRLATASQQQLMLELGFREMRGATGPSRGYYLPSVKIEGSEETRAAHYREALDQLREHLTFLGITPEFLSRHGGSVRVYTSLLYGDGFAELSIDSAVVSQWQDLRTEFVFDALPATVSSGQKSEN